LKAKDTDFIKNARKKRIPGRKKLRLIFKAGCYKGSIKAITSGKKNHQDLVPYPPGKPLIRLTQEWVQDVVKLASMKIRWVSLRRFWRFSVKLSSPLSG
jgi:hypothetical protein